MNEIREVTVRYLVHFDRFWNLLRIVHERELAPKDLDCPEGVFVLVEGNFGQYDSMGIGIIVDIDMTKNVTSTDTSQTSVSYDLVLREAKRVFRKWVLGFYEAANDAIDNILEQLNEKPEIY